MEMKQMFLENILNELDTCMKAANERISHFALRTYEHFFDIKNEIDIARETFLEEAYKNGQQDENVLNEVNRSSEYLIKSVDLTSESFTLNLNREIKLFQDLFNIEIEEEKVNEFFRNPNLNQAGLNWTKLEYKTRLVKVKKRIDTLCDLFEKKLKLSKFEANSFLDRKYLGKLYLNNLYVNETKARWKQTYVNGDWYEGDWVNDKRHGKGNRFYENGNLKYEGDWVNDRSEGKGKEYYENGGLEYEGDWMSDNREGKGKQYYKNGDWYDGDWVNDKREGKGKYYYENSKLKYEGNWISDNREGEGKFYYENGDYYEGDFKKGNKEGKGKYYYANGELKYEGEWLNDKIESKGKEFYENCKLE